jgi:hypothetical protein
MIIVLGFIGAGILAATAIFTYFGGYWYALLKKDD